MAKANPNTQSVYARIGKRLIDGYQIDGTAKAIVADIRKGKGLGELPKTARGRSVPVNWLLFVNAALATFGVPAVDNGSEADRNASGSAKRLRDALTTHGEPLAIAVGEAMVLAATTAGQKAGVVSESYSFE